MEDLFRTGGLNSYFTQAIEVFLLSGAAVVVDNYIL